jgi:hypothetical protein
VAHAGEGPARTRAPATRERDMTSGSRTGFVMRDKPLPGKNRSSRRAHTAASTALWSLPVTAHFGRAPGPGA